MEKAQVIRPVSAKIDIAFPPLKTTVSDDGNFIIIKFGPVTEDEMITPEMRQFLAESKLTPAAQKLKVFDHRPSTIAFFEELKPGNFGDIVRAGKAEEFFNCLNQPARVEIKEKKLIWEAGPIAMSTFIRGDKRQKLYFLFTASVYSANRWGILLILSSTELSGAGILLSTKW